MGNTEMFGSPVGDEEVEITEETFYWPLSMEKKKEDSGRSFRG